MARIRSKGKRQRAKVKSKVNGKGEVKSERQK